MSYGEEKIPEYFGDLRDGVLYHLVSMLEDMGMDAASILIWFIEPNRYLYGRTPLSEVEVGNFLNVLHAVRAIREGSFGLNPTDDRDKK
mgnify:CR=1 FL=1